MVKTQGSVENACAAVSLHNETVVVDDNRLSPAGGHI